jgi:hypothetical protein
MTSVMELQRIGFVVYPAFQMIGRAAGHGF